MPDNLSVVQQMMGCYSRMDAAGLEPLLHPQARHTAPGSDFGTDIEGRDRIAGYFRERVFPSFDRVKLDVVFLWEDRERSAVVVEWRSHLWPRTGKNYSNSGVFVIELRDGLIYWVREYFDTEKAHQHVTA
jgi:ketosteroid isomerase-like protein